MSKTTTQLETELRRMKLHMATAKIQAEYRELEAKNYRVKFREIVKELEAIPDALSAAKSLSAFIEKQEGLIEEMYRMLDNAQRQASKRRKTARRKAEQRIAP